MFVSVVEPAAVPQPAARRGGMRSRVTGGICTATGVATRWAGAHRKLRQHGGVTPPREFVFMDRAAIGLGGVFLHLKAEINWHRLFHDLIADFDTGALAKRQKTALDFAGLSLPA